MSQRHDLTEHGARRRWLILLVGLIAMTAGCTFQYGLAYLIPALRQEGLSLELASILVACPTAGLLLTLIAWGAAADRWGERVVLATGLAVAGAVLLTASFMSGPAALGLLLGLAGAAGGSVFAASGRLILGWFAATNAAWRWASGRARSRSASQSRRSRCRHLALRARRCPSVPGRILPDRRCSGRSAGPRSGASAGAAAVRSGSSGRARDHGAPGRSAGDWPVPAEGSAARSAAQRGVALPSAVLWRIHAASALLVVPQFTVATFALVFLTDARGWDTTGAGRRWPSPS